MGCASSIDVRNLQSERSLHVTQDNESVQSLHSIKTSQFTIKENVTTLKQTKTNKDIQSLLKLLQSHFIFYVLTEDNSLRLIHKMTYTTLRYNQLLYKPGQSASSMFILDRGIVSLEGNLLYPGSTIGEMNILQNTAKPKNVVAIEDSYFWTLDKQIFLQSLNFVMNKKCLITKEYISQSNFYKYLTQYQRECISSSVITAKYWPNQIIVFDDEYANSHFIIKNGEAGIYKNNKLIKTLQAKDSFGDSSLIKESKRSATVKAITECECLILTNTKLKEVLGNDPRCEYYKSIIRYRQSLIKQCHLNQLYIEQILNKFKFRIYTDCQTINSEVLADYLIIIVDGSFTCGTLSYAKSQLLIDIPPNYEVKCNGTIAYIPKNEINLNKRRINKKEEFKFNSLNPFLFQLEDWNQLENSSYGDVYKVKYQNQQLIIRQTTKEILQSLQLEKQFKQERKVLESIKHPLIANLHTIYEQENQYLLLQEFVKGKLLSDYIQDNGILQRNEAEFVVAQMILLMEYLHSQNIISRQFRPDCFIINTEFQTKMIDFKLSKKVSKTSTIIGAPHYMAPEIMDGKGYNESVDLWSLGICLYEFVCGGVPFGEDCEDPYQIYQLVLNCKVIYPQFYQDRHGRALITQLLNLNPKVRLGASFASLKANQYFKTINWEELEEGKMSIERHIPLRRQQLNMEVR